MPKLPPMLTAKEVAALLGKDDSTIHRWALSGRLTPAFEGPGPNGARLFLEADVHKLKAELDAAAADETTPAVTP